MANVYFMSDAHLDHKNICNFRTQFSSVEEHNALIKENYHKVVTKRDVVFMLGDMCFSKEMLCEVKSWVAEKKILICGNHDLERGITMQDLCNTYDAIYSLHKYKGMWLSHAPIHPQELRGKFNVHGHMHFDKIDDPKYLNVCMEHTDFSPIDLNEVRRRLNIVEKVYK